jgi:hypothetical protein
MKKPIALAFCLLILGSAAFASHTALIGGFRDGMAFGMQTEQKFANRWEGNFAMETTTGEDMSFTGDNPLTLFTGLKYGLGSLGLSPAFLCFGAVGNFGINSEYGGYTSLTFENIYNNPELFLDCGFDIFTSPRHAHFFVQLGYHFLEEAANLR